MLPEDAPPASGGSHHPGSHLAELFHQPAFWIQPLSAAQEGVGRPHEHPSCIQPDEGKFPSTSTTHSDPISLPFLLDSSLIRRLKLTRRVVVLQGQSGLAGPAHAGRSFPKRSFMRPSWMEEDTVDSADTSESVFFSKVSQPPSSTGAPGLASKTPAFLWFLFSCLCLVFVQSVS